ncbi:MAG: efflux RND transporter periplasmic adaptor subunit [Acidobacteria bacterium]|nr:efflux RND transporter periplasmic adaptor subunit [Acidobacteriota bacterium]
MRLVPTSLTARWLAVVLLVAGAGLAACGRPPGEAGATPAHGADGKDDGTEVEDTAVPVEVVALDRGPIEAVLRFSTNLEAESAVEVLAEANRQVRQLLVEEGDPVRRGQVLLRLQDDEQRNDLAKVEVELRKAERDYDRQQRLYDQGFLSEEDYNSATYEIEQLQLRLQEAQRQLSYTEVRAPISGTVTSRKVNLGDFVTINQPLFELVDFDSIVARVFVPEKELANLERGQEARISAQALAGRDFRGHIERIAPVVDPKSGTVKVTIALDDRSGLRPGLYVDVSLVTAVHEQAVLVPKRALVYDQDQVFVYRLSGEDHVERLELEAALEDKVNVEPRGDVLDAGDRIVVAGQAGLKDGAEVRLVSSLGEPTETAPSSDSLEAR